MIGERIVFFLLFFLPFVVYPRGLVPFEFWKIALFYISVDTWAILWLIEKQKRRTLHQFDRETWIVFGGIFLLSFYHLFLVPTQTQLIGNPYRLQGILFLWHLDIFVILSARIRMPNPPSWLVSWLLIAHAVFAVAIKANAAGRAIGFLGEPNALAGTVLFLWPFLFFPKTSPLGVWKVLGVASGLLVIILSGSRSGIVGLGVQLGFLALVFATHLPFGRIVAVSLLLLVASLALPFFQGSIYENRADIWRIAWYAGWLHPVLGGGFGNTEAQIHEAAMNLASRSRYYSIDSGHNIFLDWWVAGGVVGLSFFTIFLYKTISSYSQRFAIGQTTLLLGLLAVLLFNPGNSSILIAFWWLIGQGLKGNEVRNAEPKNLRKFTFPYCLCHFPKQVVL